MHLVLARPVCQILKVNAAPEPKSFPAPALKGQLKKLADCKKHELNLYFFGIFFIYK